METNAVMSTRPMVSTFEITFIFYLLKALISGNNWYLFFIF